MNYSWKDRDNMYIKKKQEFCIPTENTAQLKEKGSVCAKRKLRMYTLSGYR